MLRQPERTGDSRPIRRQECSLMALWMEWAITIAALSVVSVLLLVWIKRG